MNENITEEKLQRIRKEYGEAAYSSYLAGEKAVEGKDNLSKIEREYFIMQAYGSSNVYLKQQHRHIRQIITGTEPTQDQINGIADEALKNIL